MNSKYEEKFPFQTSVEKSRPAKEREKEIKQIRKKTARDHRQKTR